MVDLDGNGVGLLVEIEEFSLVLVFFLSRSWINKTRKTLVYVSVTPVLRLRWLWYLCVGGWLNMIYGAHLLNSNVSNMIGQFVISIIMTVANAKFQIEMCKINGNI